MLDSSQDLEAWAHRYWRKFDRIPPEPYGVGPERHAELLRQAVESGDPEVDPWKNLPPGADA